MDEYKSIATKHLIEIFGEEWVAINKNNICTMIYDNGPTVQIVFSLINMLLSEKEIIENRVQNYQPNGSISFDINKKDKTCKVFKNLMP